MIDKLPDLALHGVLSHLNFKGKIRLKGVCKRLNCFLTHHLESTRRLFVYGDFIHPNETWRNRPVRREECIQLNLFLGCLTEGYFKRLKILFLHSCVFHYRRTWSYEQVHQAPLLDCLAKLDELFITDYIYHWKIPDRTREDFMYALPCPQSYESPVADLNLPGLKSFIFKTPGFFSQGKILKIHSQSLERLVIWNLGFKVSLSNPEKIEYIECKSFSKNFQQHAFPNLIELRCKDVPENFYISNYPKLRKLLICPGDSPDGSFEADRLKEVHVVDSLVRQRKQLERFDLEILVSGFKGLTDRPISLKCLLPLRIYLNPVRLERLKENFSNFVGPLPGPTVVNFPPSIELASNLSRYLADFFIVEVVLAYDQLDPDLAIKFLQEINGVCRLRVYCEFGLPFYARLSSVPFIHMLSLYDPVIDCFDFLCSIKMLQFFYLMSTSLPIDHFGQLIERSKINFFDFIVTSTQKIRFRYPILFDWSVAKKGPDKGVRIRRRLTEREFPRSEHRFETVQESVAFLKSGQSTPLENIFRC